MGIKAPAMKVVAGLLKQKSWRNRLEGKITEAFFSPPNLDKVKKVLCVQPHPDDNDIGMGGTVQWMVAKGIQVDYLTVTDGGLGTYSEKLKGKNLVATRREEAKKAGRLLGVKNFLFLDKPDGSLQDVVGLAGEICEILRIGKYDAVFCPDPNLPYEAHRDHIVTGQAVSQATISTNLLEYPRGTVTEPYDIQAIGYYYTKKPNSVFDVSKFFGKKFKAIAAHKSQVSGETLEMYRMYFTLQGAKLGEEHGYKLAEGLKLLAPIHLHCITEAEDI